MQGNLFDSSEEYTNTPISQRPQDKQWTVSLGKLMVVNSPPRRKVLLNYALVSEYNIGDAENERIAVVYAIINGAGKQKRIADLWGIHYNTVNNYMAAYRKEGLKGLTQKFYDPTARRETSRKKRIEIKEEEQSYLLLPQEVQPESQAEAIPFQIATAEHQTENSEDESVVKTGYAGKMLYYPFINEVYQSILQKAETIEPAEGKKKFGLKQIIVTLLFHVLCGIRNPEESKAVRRKELGMLIGETAAPCCKTLRKGLDMLTAEGFPGYIMGELPKKYVKLGYVKLGVFYVDGHFIPYYGNKDLHKGYCTQRRIAMSGHYQNWVNDVRGRPIFFYVNNSFVKFTDVIKNSMADAMKLMRETGITERLIVVFDRGAYDSKLFSELDSMRVGFITWLKGKQPAKSESAFDGKVSYMSRKGEEISYKACKKSININKYRSGVEAITIYDEKTQKQSTFINNLEYVGIKDKTDSYKIELLDGRWSQENFFKEAKVRADIDHQMGYQYAADGEGEDMEYMVANPEYIELSDRLNSFRRKLETNENNIAKMIKKHDTLKRKKTIEEYLSQKGNQKILEYNGILKAGIEETGRAISAQPASVAYNTIQKNSRDILKTVRSSILLAIRASGYNMMKAFEDIAAGCFKDHRELGKFVITLLGTGGAVVNSKDMVIVKLDPLETPAYQRAAQKVVALINKRNPVTLDGTGRRIEFEI